MAAATMSLCSSRCLGAAPLLGERPRHCRDGRPRARLPSHRRLVVLATTEDPAKSSGEADEQVPSWARPGFDETPPWACEDDGAPAGGAQEATGIQVPFYAYLLASTITAIAAIGSIFEYTNQRPVFGVLGSDSTLYAPLLGFFVFTGILTSAFLWFRARRRTKMPRSKIAKTASYNFDKDAEQMNWRLEKIR